MDLLVSIEQQLDEVEVLKSIYPNENEVIIGDLSTFSIMKKYLETNGTSFPPNKMLPITLNIEIEEGKLIVEISLPLNYPLKALPNIFLRFDKLSRQSQQQFNEKLNKYIQSIEIGDPCLYQIVQWATENVPEISTQIEDTKIEESSEENTKSSTFTRLWIYSHHIYNKAKRKSILEWAKELELTGFSMPGKPGIVCVEGTQEQCEEYWQRVKQMNWKHIEVRCRDDILQTGDTNIIKKHFSSMDEITFEVHGHRNNHMNMGAFYVFLDENQCGYAFKQLFGIEGQLSKNSKSN